MLSKQQIDSILEPTIAGMGFEFICSELANTGNKKAGLLVRIFIDKLEPQEAGVVEQKTGVTGVTLDDCKIVSQQVSRVLDVESQAQNSSVTNFSLEVSSPGLDRPLIKIEHFKRFINKKVKIKLNIPISHMSHIRDTDIEKDQNLQRNIVGYIKAVTEDKQINIQSLDSKDKFFNIAFENINKANIVPEW